MAIAVNRRGMAFLEFTPIAEGQLNSESYRPLRFTFIVVRHAERVLLVYHRQRQTWELPGGHIEEGESARDCANRELFEETGQRVEPLDFRAVLKLHDGSNDRFFYSALYSGELPSPAPFRKNDEISEITFWDGRENIGYIDDIDSAVIDLVQTGQV